MLGRKILKLRSSEITGDAFIFTNFVKFLSVLTKYDRVSEALKSIKWLNVRDKLLFCLKNLSPGYGPYHYLAVELTNLFLLIRSYAKQVWQTGRILPDLFDGRHGFLRRFLSMILRNAIKEILGEPKDTCKESFILFNKERTNLESTLRGVAGQKEIHHCRK